MSHAPARKNEVGSPDTQYMVVESALLCIALSTEDVIRGKREKIPIFMELTGKVDKLKGNLFSLE